MWGYRSKTAAQEEDNPGLKALLTPFLNYKCETYLYLGLKATLG